MTKLTGNALRLTVFIGEGDTWNHKPVFSEIVHRARKFGLAGGTALRGVEDEPTTEGLILLDEVKAVRHVGRTATDR